MKKPNAWKCPNCEIVNPLTKNTCGTCGEARPADKDMGVKLNPIFSVIGLICVIALIICAFHFGMQGDPTRESTNNTNSDAAVEVVDTTEAAQ